MLFPYLFKEKKKKAIREVTTQSTLYKDDYQEFRGFAEKRARRRKELKKRKEKEEKLSEGLPEGYPEVLPTLKFVSNKKIRERLGRRLQGVTEKHRIGGFLALSFGEEVLNEEELLCRRAEENLRELRLDKRSTSLTSP